MCLSTLSMEDVPFPESSETISNPVLEGKAMAKTLLPSDYKPVRLEAVALIDVGTERMASNLLWLQAPAFDLSHLYTVVFGWHATGFSSDPGLNGAVELGQFLEHVAGSVEDLSFKPTANDQLHNTWLSTFVHLLRACCRN